MKTFPTDLLHRLRGGTPLSVLQKRGLRIGTGVSIQPGVIIDPSHCWLITIGNNVTLAPHVHILAHDASTKRALGYTRIGRVDIGDETFIGASSIILPGVTIGKSVIIGAGSVVTKDVPENTIAVGNPATIVGKTDEYMEKHKAKMKARPIFDKSWSLAGGITSEQKQTMADKLNDGPGYVK
jgi:maltose O-acetyltransferase